MLTVNKKIVIYRKSDANEFSKKNYKVLPTGNRKVGPSINAVNSILMHSDMLGELMPKLIGMSKDDREFTKKTMMYWNSIAVNIPDTGKELEIGFVYDLRDSKKITEIEKIKGADKKAKTFAGDKQLAEYVEEFIKEEDRWRYGVPINASDYLLWRYCLNYKAVANSPDEKILGKSSDIRFYIHNEDLIKKMEKQKFNLRAKAGKIFFDVIADAELIKKYLYAMGKGAGIETMDDIDKGKLLESVYLNTPAELVDIHKDKQIDMKAYIEECINANVLRRLPNTDIIVNSTDNNPIGNTMMDAIAYLNSDVNVKLANEIKGRLRAMPKA